ncbi:ribonuclease P protein subunit p38-like [Sciurus carolinensis]|uniref:ribonuclease P protein subunit p38-like n=1 Tax=Sciurus carolinensis TaxID=30640 RepID=UPI001FB51F0F|nr:ribonuclease P protein subunit p38-like [Sciurus carolinensis]
MQTPQGDSADQRSYCLLCCPLTAEQLSDFQNTCSPQAWARGSIRKTRSLVVKTTLNDPCALCWSSLEREDIHFRLQTLEEKFKSIGLRKIEDKKKKEKKKKPPFIKKHRVERCSLDIDTSDDLKDKRPEANQQVSGWTPVQVRKQLAVGVNEVTRALERSELLLVLVCKSAKPATITSHLIQVSVSRIVPACQVPRLSETLAPVTGLKWVLALGFKKHTTDFVDEVKAIIPRVPSLTLPWLQDRSEDSGDNLEPESLGSQDKETLETSFEDLSKHKRKLGQQVSLSLQPLKIKKLIPNPNKIRKPPKSKKKKKKKKLLQSNPV